MLSSKSEVRSKLLSMENGQAGSSMWSNLDGTGAFKELNHHTR